MTLHYVLLFLKIILCITFYIILHIAFLYYVLHFAFYLQIILCITFYSHGPTSATSGPAAQSGGERTSHDISGRVDGLASHAVRACSNLGDVITLTTVIIIYTIHYSRVIICIHSRVLQPRRRHYIDDSYNNIYNTLFASHNMHSFACVATSATSLH